MSASTHLPDLNNSIEIEIEADNTLAIPQLISLLKPYLKKSDFQKFESILAQREATVIEALTLKEVERIELQSRCDGLLKRCAELEEQLGLKRQEVDGCKTTIEDLKEEMKDMYIELVGEKIKCEELKARVSQLEKERGVIDISDSDDDNKKSSVELKKEGILEKDEILVEDGDFMATPAHTRTQASRMVTSDSEDDGDDAVPIARLMKEARNQEVNRAPVSCLCPCNYQKDEISGSEGDSVKLYAELKKEGILEKDEVLMVLEDEDFMVASAPKRKRASRMVTSDNEDDEDDVPAAKLMEEENQEGSRTPVSCVRLRNRQKNEEVGGAKDHNDDDDDIPISKLRNKRLGNKNGKGEAVVHSVRRLVNAGEGSTMKDDDHERGGSSLSQNPSRMKTRNRSAVHRQLVFSAMDDAKEKKVDDVDSDSEDDSLDKFIVDGSASDSLRSESISSDPSDDKDVDITSTDSSRESSPSDVDLGHVLSVLRRKKVSKKWEYEADMLASFAENPELCMKAVCALYRRQTQEEQSVKGTLSANNRGFNQADAYRASMIAEFLLDGDLEGPPKKSIKEFVKRYPDGLEYCRKIAERYSKQLFAIYQEEEDPFFLPS